MISKYPFTIAIMLAVMLGMAFQDFKNMTRIHNLEVANELCKAIVDLRNSKRVPSSREDEIYL